MLARGGRRRVINRISSKSDASVISCGVFWKGDKGEGGWYWARLNCGIKPKYYKGEPFA